MRRAGCALRQAHDCLGRHRQCHADLSRRLGRRSRIAWHGPDRSPRRVRRGGRPLGLRQVVVDEARDWARSARFRRHRHLRRPRAWAGEDRRHGVPEPESAPLAQGHRQRAAAARDRRAAPAEVSARQGTLSQRGRCASQDRRARRLRPAFSLGAVGRHAAARLALPRTDPSARAVDARRAVRRARRLHARGIVVRAARLVAEARLHRHPSHARPARSGVPRRQHPCHERAARTHRHDQDGRSAAPARPRHLLRAAFHRHRTRVAGQDRGGAQAMSSTLEKLSPWLFTLGMFVLWELVCRIFKVDTFVLPAPSQIFQAVGQYWLPLAKNAFVTLRTTHAGFALAVAFGIVLGIIMGWSRAIYRCLYPVMIGFNSIPKVAVVPILIIWFGIASVPAVMTAFLLSFFPIVVNVATGLASMEPELEDVLRALGAKKLDIMLKVGIPRTQPYMFGSLKVAITLAFIGTVMSETIGANAGLGHLMVQAGSNFQMPLVFACLLGLAVEGIAMYAVFAYVEAYFTGWAFRSSMSAAA